MASQLNERRPGFIRERLHLLVLSLGAAALLLGVTVSAWLVIQQRAIEARQQRILEAVSQAADTSDLPGTLERVMGLSPQEAADLGARLTAAAERARVAAAATPTPAAGGAPRGANERISTGDSVNFQVRDASGRIKQSGNGK